MILLATASTTYQVYDTYIVLFCIKNNWYFDNFFLTNLFFKKDNCYNLNVYVPLKSIC